MRYTNLEFDGIDHNDYPDYCDVYLVSGECNGEKMTEDKINAFNESDLKYDYLIDYLNY
jgi:hypothetical protein